METIACQPPLRPALPCVYGPVEYHEQRALFERIDRILGTSGLEREFIALVLAERQIDVGQAGARRLERFMRFSILALRSNIARTSRVWITVSSARGLPTARCCSGFCRLGKSMR